MSIKRIDVNLESRGYQILIVHDGFEIFAKRLALIGLGNNALVITNARIRALYGTMLKTALAKNGIKAFFYNVRDSEESKSIETYVAVLKKIASIDTRKKIFLIAFGGGVVGDLCGFVAATYKRGMPYIQIPTTLLAQVDSAIGGKTAIDLPVGKNLIGAFFQPRMVYSNLEVLASLPERQIRSGLAEVVKYGMITDQRLFEYLEKNREKLLRSDKDCLAYVIASASRIKAHVVETDERETLGFRTILNFGHTVGHALETATQYRFFAHGEAISIGMACAADIACSLGFFDHQSRDRLIALLEGLRLPVRIKNVSFKPFFEAFYRDKKFHKGTIRMVLPTRIGHVLVTDDIPFSVVKNIIKERVR